MTIQPASLQSFEQKLEQLNRHLRGMENVAIAFSGGVDSSALLAQAHHILGDRALAVIADSPSLPRKELAEAREIASAIGARLRVVRTDEGQDPDYQANLGNRCYFCKAALFRAMSEVCRSEEIPWMAFGEITDDWGDHRPGAQAAKEFGVVAPLSQAGFAKSDVRALAARFELSVAEKPASACLASRIPVGTQVTQANLLDVELAEDRLADLDFGVLRVRHHGDLARVEVAANQLERALGLQAEIQTRLAGQGFKRVEFAVYPTR